MAEGYPGLQDEPRTCGGCLQAVAFKNMRRVFIAALSSAVDLCPTCRDADPALEAAADQLFETLAGRCADCHIGTEFDEKMRGHPNIDGNFNGCDLDDEDRQGLAAYRTAKAKAALGSGL